MDVKVEGRSEGSRKWSALLEKSVEGGTQLLATKDLAKLFAASLAPEMSHITAFFCNSPFCISPLLWAFSDHTTHILTTTRPGLYKVAILQKFVTVQQRVATQPPPSRLACQHP